MNEPAMNEPDSWPDVDHPVDCFCVLCLPWPLDAETDQYKETM